MTITKRVAALIGGASLLTAMLGVGNAYAGPGVVAVLAGVSGKSNAQSTDTTKQKATLPATKERNRPCAEKGVTMEKAPIAQGPVDVNVRALKVE